MITATNALDARCQSIAFSGHRFLWIDTGNQYSMTKITRRQVSAIRAEAAQAQNWRCHYCDSPMWHADPAGFAARHAIDAGSIWQYQCTAEHLLAKRSGGDHEVVNIVAACRYCNESRHNVKPALNPADFRAFVLDRMAAGDWHPQKAASLPKRVFLPGGKMLRPLQLAAYKPDGTGPKSLD